MCVKSDLNCHYMMLWERGYHKLEIEYGVGGLISGTQGKIALLGMIKPFACWKLSQIFFAANFDRYQPEIARLNFQSSLI